MRRRLAALAALPLFLGLSHSAQAAPPKDPIGDLIVSALTGALPGTPEFNMKATLYHAGAKGVGADARQAALKRVKDGETVAAVARDIGVDRVTIFRWKRTG